MQRPKGVTLLAILAALGGVLAIRGGLALMGLSAATADLALPWLSGLAAILGIVALVLGLLDLVFAFGAWGLRPWAWMLGIGLEAAGIAINLIEFRSSTVGSTVISVAIGAAVIYYLYQPHVRRAFGQSV